MNELTIAQPIELDLAGTARQAQDYAEASKSANTRRAYQSDWQHFTRWCAQHGLAALPATPETVALYITTLADQVKPGTIQRRLATISQAHQTAGYDTPTKTNAVKLVAAGIRREKGTAQQGKAAILTSDLRKMLACLPDMLIGVRDRALLLVGFASALRRSELVGLDVDDVASTRDGLVLSLRRSKTDQDGQGTTIGIPYGSNPDTCPVRCLQDWLTASGVTGGPLFRSVNRHGQVQADRLNDKTVALVIKRTAILAGLDPTKVSGHSLRVGLVTQAAINGVSDRAIMKQTRHRTRAMVDRYTRETSLFRENAATSLGL